MKSVAAALIVMLVLGCSEQKKPEEPVAQKKSVAPAPAKPVAATVTSMPSPAGRGDAEPFLAATRDGVLLSWLEPLGAHRSAFRFARYRAGKWEAPRTITQGDDLVVNAADFPSIAEDSNGVLFAHWLQKHGAESSDVRMALSRDGGASWNPSFLLNRDGKDAEHGFVTLALLPRGGVAAAWLDGRNLPAGEGSGDMTLRYATVDGNGAIADETEVDKRTCECCTTGMAMTSTGPVIVYRDRSPEEIRDIASVRRDASGWSQPRLVHADNWKINGCPVNGPQVDAIGNSAAVAWFTAANGQPRVYAAFSNDGGKTFGDAIVIDDSKPVGRVDVVMLDDNSAVVSWVKESAAGAEIRALRISRSGAPASPLSIATTTTARAAGFPRIVRSGNDVWFTWTEHDADGANVRLAKAAF